MTIAVLEKKPPEPNDEIVAYLQTLLVDAKTGELQNISIIYADVSGVVAWRVVDPAWLPDFYINASRQADDMRDEFFGDE